MKFYCDKCGKVVADILDGSKIRKGTKMVCAECYVVRPKQSNGPEMPEFMKSILEGLNKCSDSNKVTA